MSGIRVAVGSFLADTRGQDAIEYALAAGFLVVAVILLVIAFSGSLHTLYDNLRQYLVEAARMGS